MFKFKGALLSVAAAAVVGTLLVAGMAVTATSGAGTDFGGAPQGDWPTIDQPGTDPGTGNPPASPVEPPAGTNPITGGPGGSDLGAGSGPSGLPNAGYGTPEGANGLTSLFVLLGIAGAGLATAGASAFAASRRK